MSGSSSFNWSNSSSSQARTTQNQQSRPSPSASARSASPFSPQSTSTSSATNKPTGGAKGFDSFSNLLAPGANKNTATLSLQERQKQLLAEKAQQAQGGRGGDPYSASDATFWEGLGSRTSTPSVPNTAGQAGVHEDGDDLLAAFSSTAPVDASSHFPPPSTNQLHVASAPSDARNAPSSSSHTQVQSSFDDDDDPFGLGALATKSVASKPQQAPTASADDDDILGMLGRPVEEIRRSQPMRQVEPEPVPIEDERFEPRSSDPRDKAIAELVDMGFPVEKSRHALAQTDTGVNVQAAVGWLLNQAHEQTRNESQSQSQSRDASRQRPGDRSAHGDSVPSWLKGSGPPPRDDSLSPASRERDISQYASQLGSNLFKSANTLWKSGQKQVQKAMADFQQQDGDPSVPKWMRDAQVREEAEQRQVRDGASRVTDEAAMLDRAPSSRPSRGASRQPQQHDSFPPDLSSRQSPFASQTPSRPPNRGPPTRPAERLSRQQAEEQASQAYVSSARRRKPQAQAPPAEPAKPPPPEMDIFNDEAMSAPPPRPTAQAAPTASRTATPLTVRPKTTTRAVPNISPSSLSSSHGHRQKGTEAFKRGDYAAAQSHYTDALVPLPDGHPIVIVLRSNRALTNIKTGEPKAAIADAEAVLALVGPSQGEGESIDLGAEGHKPMKDFFGKALMRKAEAYEHMEKWGDALGVWRQAVEAGVGGAVAIQGRNRCEKALAPKAAAPPKPAAPKARAAAPARRPDAKPSGDSDAVRRLREANAAASAASDEQFALTDAVDAKINDWRGTKKDNLRALLASLDTVLWADAGWKKVGMGDLVIANKVKIVYMKAIAKVHPDKVSQQATTEQKMVSAAVFSTLNEAWDKFKADNNL